MCGYDDKYVKEYDVWVTDWEQVTDSCAVGCRAAAVPSAALGAAKHTHHLKTTPVLIAYSSFPPGTTGLCKQFLHKQQQCQFLPSPC